MEASVFKARFGISLDRQQEQAVQTVQGPVLLLAVPGSGKTTVLVSRIGYMLHVCGIAPEQILTMTYTVAAARDMQRRYAAVFGEEEAQRLEFRTINGVCSRIIRYYEHTLGRRAFQVLEDGGQKSALLGELYHRISGEFAAESTIKALQTAMTYVKNQMLKGEELAEIEVEGIEFPAFYRSYQQELRQRQLMDFDDQMVYALQILRQYPQVLRAFQRRYTYFCVDEAQDTSKIQHCIIGLLAGDSRNLFMVGDEDQSIYGFRAAYPQALTQFERVYPEAKVLYLEQNYRSTVPIVMAADKFIQKNHHRHPKHMRATRGDGPGIREIQVYDRQKQYRYLRKLSEKCVHETAVLYRDNDSILPLIDLLDRAGISYRCRQVDSLFFSNRVVRDIRDIICFAQNPNDGGLFLSLYYKLGAGISRILAQEAVSQAEWAGETILDYIAGQSNASPWTKKQCKALQTHLDNLLDETGDKAVYRIVHFMGYGAYLEQRGGDLHKAEILQALGVEEPTPLRLLERLEELRQLLQSQASCQESPLILSTIHSSKGLEYDRVILMDVVDGIFPKVKPEQNQTPEERELYEEERRLFYVGMTRAREELSIITFQKLGLSSVFAQELFPGREEERAAPVKSLLHIPQKMGQREVVTLSGGFLPGVRVTHKSFGSGSLTARAGDIVTILFDDGITKKISLSTAIRMEQLEMEDI